MSAFIPTGPAVDVSASPGGTRYAIPPDPAGSVLLTNLGSTDAAFAFGDVAVTCTFATGVPLMARSSSTFTPIPSSTHIFVIGPAATLVTLVPGGGE